MASPKSKSSITYYPIREAYIMDVLQRDKAQRPHVPDLGSMTAYQMLDQYKTDKHIHCKEIDADRCYKDYYTTGFKKGFKAGTGRDIENVKAPADPFSRMCGSLAILKNKGVLVWCRKGVYAIPSEVSDDKLLEAQGNVQVLAAKLNTNEKECLRIEKELAQAEEELKVIEVNKGKKRIVTRCCSVAPKYLGLSEIDLDGTAAHYKCTSCGRDIHVAAYPKDKEEYTHKVENESMRYEFCFDKDGNRICEYEKDDPFKYI